VITAEQIPPEVVEAAARGMNANRPGWPDWDSVDERWKPMERDKARAAIAAALNAWPGMATEHREILNFWNNIDGPIVSSRRVPFLILPLPQEAQDD
jgi:hypothetical protein